MFSKILKFLSSIRIFFTISGLISIMLVYDTVFNRKESIVGSLQFLILCFILFINILSCVFLRLVYGYRKISFYLIHCGILITIAGFILSFAYRFEFQIGLKKYEETDRAEFNGYIYKLPFKLKLNSFKIEYYKYPELFIKFANKKYQCSDGVEIKNGEDVYRIEKCFNDFSIDANGKYFNKTDYFNNPAALLLLNKKEKIWLFLNRTSHFDKILPVRLEIANDDIKNFKSEIEIYYKGRTHNFDVYVNEPVSFEGYKIYQTGYDPTYGEYSILTVKKDKWVWLVFIGFMITLTGVVLWIL